MILTSGQLKAQKMLKMWWTLASSPQTFEIGGYAGTGKSTIISASLEYLKLNLQEDVKYVAFTGKAALVLAQKGLPATTIHKLIYKTQEVTELLKDSNGITKLDKENQPIYVTRTKFVKVSELPSTIKLIVLDEGYMVPENIWNDLKSFGKPIIVLGDPGQLPPVHGKSVLLNDPDIMLTEIMRQAEDNPIIHLSMLAREGKRIPFGRYGKKVAVIPKENVTDKMLKNSDINIVTTNKTRNDLNTYMREQVYKRRFTTPEKGDKVISRKNKWDLAVDGYPLVNGMIGYVNSPIDQDSMTSKIFTMDFRPEFTTSYFENIEVNLPMFNAPDHKSREEILKSPFEKGNKFEYGYAISTHLSQGSSWKKVLGYYEPFGDKDMRKSLPYVMITRAEELLIFAQ